MKTTISNLIRGIIGGILLILFIIPATGNAQNIFEQHGTLHKLIGFPSFTKNTGWIGGSVLSVGAYVEFGFSVGGNIGEVSLNGNGVLSKNGSNWDLWFQGTTGLAKMNFGFQTVAQYKVTVLGYTYQDVLPILPNLDFDFKDSKSFTPYLLGGGRNVELSDALQPQKIISFSPGIPGVANVHIGISLATKVINKISGRKVNTNRGTFTSNEQHIQQNITSHYFTVSGIQEGLSDNLTMYFTPNGTIGVKVLFITKDIDIPIFTVHYALPTINFNTSPQQSITFSIPQPKLSVTPTDIDLGTHLAGTSFSKTFTVKNIGESGSTLTGKISKNLSWISSVSPKSFSLGANQFQTITVQGTFPSNPGPFSGNISVTSDGGNQNVYVHGVVQLPQYTVRLSSNPSKGGTTSGAGTYTSGTQVTITATANNNNGYKFKNWTENGNVVSNNTSYSFTIQDNRKFVANFSKKQVTVKLSSNPSDGGSTSGGGTYSYGDNVTVTATPNTGYTFKNWTENGNVVSNNTSYSFTIQDNRKFVANFSKKQVTVKLSSNPSDGGSTSGGGTYSYGDNVTVTATPNTGYTFKNWTENGNVVSTNSSYTFTIQNDRNLVANFSLNPKLKVDPTDIDLKTHEANTSFSETFTVTNSGGSTLTGNISKNASWISSISPTSFSLGANQSQTITVQGAFPSNSGSFSDNINVTSNGGNQDVYAHGNVIQQPTVNVSANPVDGGTVSGGGKYDAGSSVTVTASANSGYTFTNWTENGNIVSNSSSYTFTIQSDRTLVANFIKHELTVSPETVTLGGKTGNSTSFNITSNISWQITGVQDWFSLNKSSGSNNATITVTAEKPWPGSDRTATLTVGDNVVSKTVTVKQTSLTGISVNKLEKSIRIYPNPAKTKLFIGFNDVSLKNLNLSIYDLIGKQIYNKHYDQKLPKTIEIDLHDYQKGIYYIRFKTDKVTLTKKFLVQ